MLSMRGGRDLTTIDRRAVGFALATALTICAYSVVDGIGARASLNPQSYVLWLLVGDALTLTPYGLWRNRDGVVKPFEPSGCEASSAAPCRRCLTASRYGR